MKSKYISVGLVLCLGMFISATGQAKEAGQNAPPPLPDINAEASLPLPPELQELKGADAPPLPELKAENPEFPLSLSEPVQADDEQAPPLLPELKPEEQGGSAPELQLEASSKLEPPTLPEEAPQIPKQAAPEKPAQEQVPVITDPAAMPTHDISLFSHKFHIEGGGFTCIDCHNSIFQQTAGTAKAKGDFNMASFGQGKYCGTCHDGSTAFSVTEQGSCVRCHGSDMKLGFKPLTGQKQKGGKH